MLWARNDYRPGDHNVICDRCGCKFHASQTSKTWDGLIVCSEDFETRHPQDFVRGRKDDQTIPDGRPEAITSLVGPLTTMLSAAMTPSSTSLSVASSVRFEPTDNIGIICDDGSTVARTVTDVPDGTSITISVPLRANAAIGNIVLNYSAVAEADIG